MRRATGGLLRCSACRLERPATEFSFSSEARGTRNFYCRICQAAYRRAHYLANKADYIRRAVAQVKRRRDENRLEIVRYLQTHPCVDCGCSDPVRLEFDHVDPALKLMDVGTMKVSRRWERVEAEIAKCDVRCVNCHRLRTAKQFHWGRHPVR